MNNVIPLNSGIKSPEIIALTNQLEDVIDAHIREGQLCVAELIGVLESVKLDYWYRMWEADNR